MKKPLGLLLVVSFVPALGIAENHEIANEEDLAVYGYTPAEYVGEPRRNSCAMVEIKVNDGIIESVTKISSRKIKKLSAAAREQLTKEGIGLLETQLRPFL